MVVMPYDEYPRSQCPTGTLKLKTLEITMWSEEEDENHSEGPEELIATLLKASSSTLCDLNIPTDGYSSNLRTVQLPALVKLRLCLLDTTLPLFPDHAFPNLKSLHPDLVESPFLSSRWSLHADDSAFDTLFLNIETLTLTGTYFSFHSYSQLSDPTILVTLATITHRSWKESCSLLPADWEEEDRDAFFRNLY